MTHAEDSLEDPAAVRCGARHRAHPLPPRSRGDGSTNPLFRDSTPEPPGSMVVVAIEPDFRAMDRSGLATGTRQVATRCWRGRLPRRDPAALVRELYAAENEGRAEPSGSQDMIGLVYPGISRLDYDFRVEGAVFPARIESLEGARPARWLERVLHVLPVAPRPEGYNPLGLKRLTPRGVQRLGRTGQDCFEAIRRRDLHALGDPSTPA